MAKPKNKKLYEKVKSLTKKKFKVYPSAYANYWLSREYKKRGGKYIGKKSKSSGLDRWTKEKWINVCKLPKKVKCGRSKASGKNWKKDYPYCRPSVRVNKSTPKLASELSKAEIRRRCSQKQKNPRKRVVGISRRKSKSKRKSSKKSSRSRKKSHSKCKKGYVKDRSTGRCRKSKRKSRSRRK